MRKNSEEKYLLNNYTIGRNSEMVTVRFPGENVSCKMSQDKGS